MQEVKKDLEQHKKLDAIFKMAVLVDLMDDLSLENRSIFNQLDKKHIKSFTKYFTAKYSKVIDGIINIDLKNDKNTINEIKEGLVLFIDKSYEITE